MFPLVDLNTESAGSFAAVVNLFANQCDIFRRVPWWAFSALWCSSNSSPHAPAATSHLILTQQAHGQMCKEAGSHSASVLFHRMPLHPRSAKCVPAFCKLLLFITHTCGSGTNANSRFGLVLFCLLMKRLLLFLIQWSAWSGQQCLYEKVAAHSHAVPVCSVQRKDRKYFVFKHEHIKWHFEGNVIVTLLFTFCISCFFLLFSL